jgi:hypothetical protein
MPTRMNALVRTLTLLAVLAALAIAAQAGHRWA